MSYMRSADRQQQILNCAKNVFSQRGYHGANISHICAEANIGRGTLYQYFPNKKAVFAAILEETLARVHAQMRRESRPTLVPPEELKRPEINEWSARRLHRLLAIVFDDERTLRILLREAVGLDVEIENLLFDIDDAIISLLASQLEVFQQAGIVRELDPRVTATLMVGAVEKLALSALRSEQPVDLMQLARAATQLHNFGLLSDRVRRD